MAGYGIIFGVFMMPFGFWLLDFSELADLLFFNWATPKNMIRFYVVLIATPILFFLCIVCFFVLSFVSE